MDIRGIWKVKEMRLPSPDGELVFTPGNLPDDEQFEEFGRMMQCRTEFADDGSLNTLMFVPEEMKAEAAEHGVVVREDGYAVIVLRVPLGKKKTGSSTMTQRQRAKFSEKR